jgi:AMMECR1 domain-containing protein
MLYSWNLSLTADGNALAARCLLDRLNGFKATQLATYGTTGIPLMVACILLGNGKYTGICLREQPKGSKGGRQIEGPADPSRPVVLIDDSLSSGTSLFNGIQLLEGHGFAVEGTVCLVHFPARGGRERAEALGYKVETLFDVWKDLGMPRPVYIPGFQRVPEVNYNGATAPDGMCPAALARRVAEGLLKEGIVLSPPKRFDAQYDGCGGVWVSFRDPNSDARFARDGFWHFNAGDSEPCRDVVLATVKAVRSGRLSLTQLDALKIAVTFFGKLEPIRPGKLDFAKYGIVIRSIAWPVKVGGALPNTQVFNSEREQLDLALRNSGVGNFEPYELYRHTVTKVIEQSEKWLPYGVPDPPEHKWTRDGIIGTALTKRAREAAIAAAHGKSVMGTPLSADTVPARVAGVSVTLYLKGLIGCAVSSRPNLDEAVVSAAKSAMSDNRFACVSPDNLNEVVAAVSVLYDPEWLGLTTAQRAATKLRLGRDSLSVQQGDRRALFLESVGPHYDWGKAELAQRLLQKAGATGGPAHWTTYRTATWLYDENCAVLHTYGFAAPLEGSYAASAVRDDLALLGTYIERNLLASGLPRYAHSPVPGWSWDKGSAARVLHGLSGLLAAGRALRRSSWVEKARRGIHLCLQTIDVSRGLEAGTLNLEGQRCGPMADCELIAAACGAEYSEEMIPQLEALAARVAKMFRADGSIHPDQQPVRMQGDNDYLPNAAMRSLAAFYSKEPKRLAARLEPYRAWQLQRFRLLHRWGQAGWLPQACAEVFRATADKLYATTAFEVVDWCIEQQIESTGAFLTDLSSDGPSFHTAFIAEAVADAWELALLCNEHGRARRYEAAWKGAMCFARQLIIRPVDSPCLANPSLAVGGVRGSLTTSTIRIDYVSHVAIAMSKGLHLSGSNL